MRDHLRRGASAIPVQFLQYSVHRDATLEKRLRHGYRAGAAAPELTTTERGNQPLTGSGIDLALSLCQGIKRLEKR
jgi:hypothetical protein